MRTKHVYVQNFGAFWKLTWVEWIELCRSAVNDPDWGGYELPRHGELRSKPPWLLKNLDGPGWWKTREDRHYVEPLDWSPEDFRDWLAEHAPEELSASPESSAGTL